METQTRNYRGLTIANIVLSIIFGVATASFASFISIFNTEDVIGTAFGIIIVTVLEFIFVVFGLVWLIINFLLLARMHEADIGLGSKKCSIFYGIAGGIVGATVIGFIVTFILVTTNSIQYITWVNISTWIDLVAAGTFIASFIFTLIHLKRM